MSLTVIGFALIPIVVIAMAYHLFAGKMARDKKEYRKKTKEYEIRKEVFNKPKNSSVWINMVDDQLYSQLREMGNGNLSIAKWQKQRILKVGVLTAIGLFYSLSTFQKSGLTTNTYVTLLISMFLPIFLYFSQKRTIGSVYNRFRFERQMQFSKFCRLLVPYLKQKNSRSMYSVFNKIVPRLDYEADRNQLKILMKAMTDTPNSIQPYQEFAKKMSGTDMADSFMTTLFDLTQGVRDTSVVEELGKMASESMMDGIDQIIHFKSKKFVFLPTKIAFAFIIIILGYALAMLLHNIGAVNISFG